MRSIPLFQLNIVQELGGQCEVVWEESGNVILRGRPELLHSAIENLVRNALKHAPESRTVWVETSRVATQRHYLLRVLDEGAGVPQEALSSLFSPFFRGANTANMEGYGLLLAIACTRRRDRNRHPGPLQGQIQDLVLAAGRGTHAARADCRRRWSPPPIRGALPQGWTPYAFRGVRAHYPQRRRKRTQPTVNNSKSVNNDKAPGPPQAPAR